MNLSSVCQVAGVVLVVAAAFAASVLLGVAVVGVGLLAVGVGLER